MKNIYIFSSSIDRPSIEPVVEHLRASYYNSQLYLSDRVVSGADQFKVALSNGKNNFDIEYNGEPLQVEHARSAWFRHPQLTGLYNIEDKAKLLSIEDEIDRIHDSLWQIVPDKAWLNSPSNIKKAQTKLTQLALANELGFETPDTVVSNNWDSIKKALGDSKVLVKMPKGLLYENNVPKVMYATRIDLGGRSDTQNLNPFPAIYQRYIEKKREWRITVVDNESFEAAIYTTNEAKDDWRKHQLTSHVTFRSEKFPDEISARCIKFLGRLGLKFGAFDFIEDDDGKITFLECNSNGQYYWLEDQLGFPISRAIADALIRNYRANSQL